MERDATAAARAGRAARPAPAPTTGAARRAAQRRPDHPALAPDAPPRPSMPPDPLDPPTRRGRRGAARPPPPAPPDRSTRPGPRPEPPEPPPPAPLEPPAARSGPADGAGRAGARLPRRLIRPTVPRAGGAAATAAPRDAAGSGTGRAARACRRGSRVVAASNRQRRETDRHQQLKSHSHGAIFGAPTPGSNGNQAGSRTSSWRVRFGMVCLSWLWALAAAVAADRRTGTDELTMDRRSAAVDTSDAVGDAGPACTNACALATHRLRRDGGCQLAPSQATRNGVGRPRLVRACRPASAAAAPAFARWSPAAPLRENPASTSGT